VDREAEPGIKAVQMLALNHHKSRAASLSAMQARDSPFLTWQNCPLITHAPGIFLSQAPRLVIYAAKFLCSLAIAAAAPLFICRAPFAYCGRAFLF